MSPTRLPRACRIGSCSQPAVSRGRCAQHAKPDEAHRHRFGAAIYADPRWRHPRHGLRAQVLRRDPLCVLCLKQGRATVSTVADHIRPHRGDERLAFDINNLRGICKPCHDRVTAGQTLNKPAKSHLRIYGSP